MPTSKDNFLSKHQEEKIKEFNNLYKDLVVSAELLTPERELIAPLRKFFSYFDFRSEELKASSLALHKRFEQLSSSDASLKVKISELNKKYTLYQSKLESGTGIPVLLMNEIVSKIETIQPLATSHTIDTYAERENLFVAKKEQLTSQTRRSSFYVPVSMLGIFLFPVCAILISAGVFFLPLTS